MFLTLKVTVMVLPTGTRLVKGMGVKATLRVSVVKLTPITLSPLMLPLTAVVNALPAVLPLTSRLVKFRPPLVTAVALKVHVKVCVVLDGTDANAAKNKGVTVEDTKPMLLMNAVGVMAVAVTKPIFLTVIVTL